MNLENDDEPVTLASLAFTTTTGVHLYELCARPRDISRVTMVGTKTYILNYPLLYTIYYTVWTMDSVP